MSDEEIGSPPACFCCMDAAPPLLALGCACIGTSLKHVHLECLAKDFQRRGEYAVKLQNGARFIKPSYTCAVCNERAGADAMRALAGRVEQDIATWDDRRGEYRTIMVRARSCGNRVVSSAAVALSSAAATAAVMHYFVYDK